MPSVEQQAENIAAKQAPQIDAPTPPASSQAQIPLSLVGMGNSGLDQLVSNIKQRAIAMVPQIMAARENSAKNDADAAHAEAQLDQKYREQLADIYKNYKPETVRYEGPPNQPEQNPLKQFGSLASMLGIFASLFTKQSAVNALNASASAMNAIKRNDQTAYNNAFKSWKENTDLTLRKNEQEREFLHDRLNLAKTDQAAALAEIKAYAAEHNWPAAAMLARAGDLEGLAQLAHSLEMAGNKLGNFKDIMMTEGIQDFVAKHGRPPTFSELADINAQASGKGGEAVPVSPEAVDMMAQTYRQTGVLPALGYGRAATQLRSQIIERAAQMNKSDKTSVGDMLANQAEVKASRQSLGKLRTQADSAISFENTALDNMKIAYDLMDRGAGTSAGSVLNRWLQAGKQATGDPDVKAFNDAIATVANEYAKIMSGSTGAQGATDTARREAHDMVSGIDSPQAIRKVFESVMKPDMENRKKNYLKQIDEIKSRISGEKAPHDYASADDVRAAYKNGELTKDEAKEALKKFGYE